MLNVKRIIYLIVGNINCHVTQITTNESITATVAVIFHLG